MAGRTIDDSRGVDLTTRVALRANEAARALGISPRKLRELRPELPHFYADGVLLFPVETLREWVRSQAAIEAQTSEAIARKILDPHDDEIE